MKLLCFLLHGLLGNSLSLEAPKGFLKQRHLSRPHEELLQRSLPQSQEDLAVVVPALKAGDKAGFKAHLVQMVHNGGTERIKHCLQALSVAGYRALEVQNWLKSESAPVPQTKLQTHYLEAKAEKKQQEKTEATKQRSEATQEKSDATTEQEETAALQHVLGQRLLTGERTQEVTQEKMQEEESEQDEAAKVIGERLLGAPMVGEDRKKSELQDGKAGIGQLADGEVKQEDASSPSVARSDEEVGLHAVGKLDEQEAELKSSASSSEERISKLEKEVAEEAQARRQMERENNKLRDEVAEQSKRYQQETHQLDVASQKVSAKLESLQEDIKEFRAALAGAEEQSSSS
eukprot:TRINITY_DN76457_c0_g1_i1.p1 TRINITY_DN76457_c0_g1~~TRINITY_DN76457_c0_g1_i1.p1  ORF type:complete len:347 (-),score=97.02 TRINITY_DN76457_c0_g1_i1:140-1180(-)